MKNTEKLRFQIFDCDEVEDTLNIYKCSIWCQDDEEAEVCCKWLNDLQEEINQLKQQLKEADDLISQNCNHQHRKKWQKIRDCYECYENED